MSDSAPQFRPLRILVADDEPMIVRALERVLEKRGHTVLVAETADGACLLLESEKVDAVLVDQNMPGSGLAILQCLFDQPDGFEGLAILMTGGMDDGELDEISGEVQRLQKPFRFGEVVPLIEQGCN